jgi:two-component system, chemotaxis family, chemotaxis protein CheY
MTKRVLVVDDDHLYVELARELLESDTVSVVSAPNGAVALDMLRSEPAHMIMSDIEMPVMDGITFCEKLKNLSRLNAIPFVFVSGTHRDSVIAYAQKLSGGQLYSKSDLYRHIPAILERMA